MVEYNNGRIQYLDKFRQWINSPEKWKTKYEL